MYLTYQNIISTFLIFCFPFLGWFLKVIINSTIEKGFNKKFAEFNSSLAKQNINFQIYNVEYVKLRFQRLDILLGKLFEFKKFYSINFGSLNIDDLNPKILEVDFYKQYEEVTDALNNSKLYFEEETIKIVDDFLKHANVYFFKFLSYKSSVKQLERAYTPHNQIFLKIIR